MYAERLRRKRAQEKAERRANQFAYYSDKPVEFITDELHEQPWSIQKKIAEAVRDHPQVAVPSCFGSGKDWIAARLVAHWVATGGVVITTADTYRQVRDILWRELRRAHVRGGLPGTIPAVESRWEIGGSEAFAIGVKPEDYNAEGFQGIHARKVLVVIDEANGVSEELFKASLGLVVNEASRILAIGNPHEPVGPFFEACRSQTWHVIHISVFDTPNFKCACGEDYTAETRDPDWSRRHAGHGSREAITEKAKDELVSPYWVERRRQEGLEGTPWWQAKVLGQFPDTASNAVIPLAWVEQARARGHLPDHREWAGLDVARFGTDDSALVEGSGNGPESCQVVHGQDTMAVAGLGMRYLQARRGTLAVDVIGVGGGVVDRIREQHPPGQLLAVNVAESPDHDTDLLANLRSQLWWDARLAFAPESADPLSLMRLSETDYARLRAELTAPTYRMTSSGKVQVESKEELKARGLPSPDLADAFNLALYARSRARRRVSSFGAAA